MTKPRSELVSKETPIEIITKIQFQVQHRLQTTYNENSSQEESQLRSIVCGLYAKYSNDKEFNNYFVNLFETNKYAEYNDGNYYNLVLSIAGMDPSVSVTKYLDKFIQAETPQIEGRYRAMLWGLSDPNCS